MDCENVLRVAGRVFHAGVPVVESQANQQVVVGLEHLVATDETSNLSLAVFHQATDVVHGSRSKNYYAQIQLRALRFLRIPKQTQIQFECLVFRQEQ